MSPIWFRIIDKIAGYLIEHADEIIDAIREEFAGHVDKPAVDAALNAFKAAPSSQNFEQIEAALELSCLGGDRLASVVVNKTEVPL